MSHVMLCDLVNESVNPAAITAAATCFSVAASVVTVAAATASVINGVECRQ